MFVQDESVANKVRKHSKNTMYIVYFFSKINDIYALS